MREMYMTSLRIQTALIEATAATTLMMIEYHLRFLKQQTPLLSQAIIHRRALDSFGFAANNPEPRKQIAPNKAARKVKSPCCGEDLHDHYGKRALDIDVEHI